jgi:hypothetical protein
MERRKAAHRRKDSNYRNAVVALYAPASSSQDRVVGNVRQPLVSELSTDAVAQIRVRYIGLRGHAIGIKLIERTERAFKRRPASACCVRFTRGALGGLALAPGAAQFRNVGAEYLDPIHVPLPWLIKNLASDPPLFQRT